MEKKLKISMMTEVPILERYPGMIVYPMGLGRCCIAINADTKENGEMDDGKIHQVCIDSIDQTGITDPSFVLIRHGHGKLENPDGDCYEGTFVYDEMHGSGTYTWKNGNVYRGAFNEGKRHGTVRQIQ